MYVLTCLIMHTRIHLCIHYLLIYLIFLYIYPSIHTCIYIYIYIYLFVYTYSLSIYTFRSSIYLFIYPYIHTYMYLPFTHLLFIYHSLTYLSTPSITRAVVLNQGYCGPEGTSDNIRRHFWLSQLAGVLLDLLSRDQGCSSTPHSVGGCPTSESGEKPANKP